MAARADTITGLVHKRSSRNIVMYRLMYCQWLDYNLCNNQPCYPHVSLKQEIDGKKYIDVCFELWKI